MHRVSPAGTPGANIMTATPILIMMGERIPVNFVFSWDEQRKPYKIHCHEN